MYIEYFEEFDRPTWKTPGYVKCREAYIASKDRSYEDIVFVDEFYAYEVESVITILKKASVREFVLASTNPYILNTLCEMIHEGCTISDDMESFPWYNIFDDDRDEVVGFRVYINNIRGELNHEK